MRSLKEQATAIARNYTKEELDIALTIIGDIADRYVTSAWEIIYEAINIKFEENWKGE